MAKKIVLSSTEVTRASNALKDFHVEHVLVSYPEHQKENKPATSFIVVLNKDLNLAKEAIAEAKLSILKIKNSRHFHNTIVKVHAHFHQYYKPDFECKCRNCGKIFTSHVKEAVWCSKKCKQDFRNAKKKEAV